MCNRYTQTGSPTDIQKAINAIGLIIVSEPSEKAIESSQDVFPDREGLILRQVGDDEAELTEARWGFPKVKTGGRPITNIRNLNSPWWSRVNRKYLYEPEYRCLVPFTSFAEPPRDPTWFSVPNQTISFFAGIWRPWKGSRLAEQEGKARRVRTEADWELYAFLTTEANDVVKPYHENAMPVILTEPEEWSLWLSGGSEGLRLQRPLPNESLRIAASPSFV